MGIVVAAIAVVAAIFIIGITGFVAPGFFVGGDDDKSSSSNEEGGDLEAFAKKLVAAADDKDTDELENLSCEEVTSDVTSAIRQIPATRGAELVGSEEVDETRGTVRLTINVNGNDRAFTAITAKNGDDWCWQGLEQGGNAAGPSGLDPSDPVGASPRGRSTGSDTEANGKFASDFLAAINSGQNQKPSPCSAPVGPASRASSPTSPAAIPPVYYPSRSQSI